MRTKTKNGAPRRLRYGLTSTLLLLLGLAVLAGGNVIAQRLERDRAWKTDLSFNAQTSIGEVTRAVLDGLESDVRAYVLYQNDAVLFDLLDRYAAATPHFTWERTDAALNPGLMARFRSALPENTVDTNSLVFHCERTDRYRVVRYDQMVSLAFDDEGSWAVSGIRYESAITAAIRYVSGDTVPRILILQGHGEPGPEETALLTSLWESNAFDAESGTLNAFDLRSGDLLAILSPLADLTDAEYARVLDFTRDGGCLLISCDPETPVASMPNFEALLRLYNFSPKPGIVCAAEDAQDGYYAPYRNWLIPTLQPSEITAQMLQSGAGTLLLPDCRAFAAPADTDNYAFTDEVLSSGEGSYLVPLSRAAGTGIARAEGDETGPFPLALLSKRITEDGHASISRAFVIGSSSALLDPAVYAMTDAQEFILRVTDTLFGHASADAGIMARDAVRPELSARSHAAGTLAVFMLPALVAAAAVVVLGIRRRRTHG